MIEQRWGLSNPWRASDPNRPCFTCGAAPTHRYPDGSPAYRNCQHTPYRGEQQGYAPSLTITLREADLEAAERCAQKMYERGAARKDRQGVRSIESNRLGYAGELAFARLVGLAFKCDPLGFSKPDVGRYQVRTSSGSPFLVVHENDANGVPVALMIGKPPTFTLAGWLPDARLGKRANWYRDPGGRRPAFFVPLSALRDPLTLPELVADEPPDDLD